MTLSGVVLHVSSKGRILFKKQVRTPQILCPRRLDFSGISGSDFSMYGLKTPSRIRDKPGVPAL